MTPAFSLPSTVPLSGPLTDAPPAELAGRYHIHAELARGGMGVVYRATDTAFDRAVVVKTVQPQFADRPGVLARFATESRITGRLQHPAVPPVYDHGTLPDGRPFLAMKLVEGQTLDELLTGGTDPGRLVAAFEGVCQAVGYAHSRAVIHRDLKPANVMVGAFGEVQVMDWGLAKDLAAVSREAESSEPSADPAAQALDALLMTVADATAPPRTRAGSVLGTLAYMPPEQANGLIDKVDRRSDVFGLGAVLCRILSGHPPYTGTPDRPTYQMALDADLTPCLVRLDKCDADAGLIALCKRCLSVDPDERPADGTAVAAEVAAWRAATEERARRAELAAAEGRVREAEGRRRRRLLGAASGLVFAVVLAALVKVRQESGAKDLALTEKSQALADKSEAVVALTAAQDRSRAVLRKLTDKTVADLLARKAALTVADRAYLDDVKAYWAAEGAGRGGGLVARELRAEGLARVAALARVLGEKSAEADFLAARDEYQTLTADHPARADFRLELGKMHNQLGLLRYDLGRRDVAAADHRAGKAVLGPLAAEFPDRPDYAQELARHHNNLGRCHHMAKELADAEREYRVALAVRERLAAGPAATADDRRDLTRTQYNLAMLVRDNDRAEATTLLRAAVAVREALAAAAPGDPDERFNLLRAAGQLAAHERTPAALGRVAEVARPLAADFPLRTEFANELVVALTNLGDILGAAAEPARREAVEVQAKLVERNPGRPDYAVRLGNCRANLARLLCGPGRADADQAEAVALLRAAVEAKAVAPGVIAADPAFAKLRGRADFRRLTGQPELAPPPRPVGIPPASPARRG